MAGTCRLARFITEACPPQFVSVMRRRTPTVLDTINEEDHSSSSSRFSLSSPPPPPSAPPTSAAVSSKYFLDQALLRHFCDFEH